MNCYSSVWLYALFQIGAFFMINLCLVVIATQFSETKKREMDRMLAERMRFHSSSTLASIGEPGSCYRELIKYIEHIVRKAFRKAYRLGKVHFRRCGNHRSVSTEQISLQHRRHRRRHRQHHHRRRRRHAKIADSALHTLSVADDHSPPPPRYHHHHYHLSPEKTSNPRADSPRAPKASPEVSDIDLHSSNENVVVVGPSSAKSLQFRDLLSPQDVGRTRPSSLSSLRVDRRLSLSPWRSSRSNDSRRLAALGDGAISTKSLCEAGLNRTEIDSSIHPSSSQPVCDVCESVIYSNLI